MTKALPLLLTLTLAACSNASYTRQEAPLAKPDRARLTNALSAQPEDVQARYVYRHPQETLAFFELAPGMTVLEALPGGGWYTKILIDYLGSDGHLIGADYAMGMWPKFGFFDDAFIDKKKTWTQDWTSEANGWRAADDARISAFVFGSMPAMYRGKVDAVLFIRALHNLNRFENDGGYLTAALKDAHDALKPGGIVGVVQHQARDDMPDSWADGSKGYLKKAALIASFEAAGFEFVDESNVNANPKDRPTTDDIVWRLPPTLVTSRDDDALKARMQAIGESNRMTLKFRKRG